MKQVKEAAARALQALTAQGAETASDQAVTTRKTELNAEGGKFTLLRTTLDHSLSLQAITDGRRGTVSGNSFEEEAISAAAKDCLASARAGQSDAAWEMAKEGQGSFQEGDPEPDLDRLYTRTAELIDTVHREYP